MLKLLGFLFEAGSAAGSNTEQQGALPGWVIWVVMGVLLVAMIIFTSLSNKKRQKKQEEMMSQFVIGCTITTIGGIIGELVQFDDKHIWIVTGLEGSQCTLKFMRSAVHSVSPAPGSAEAIAIEKEEVAADNAPDEIV